MTDDSDDEEVVRAASTTDTPIDESEVGGGGGGDPDGFGGGSGGHGASEHELTGSGHGGGGPPADASAPPETHAPGDRVTVDLQDRVADIEERMAEIEHEAAPLDRDSQAYREQAEAYEELDHAKGLIEQAIEQWGGSAFTIVKFNAGRDAQVNDRIRQELSEAGVEDPAARFDAIKNQTVQVGVVDSPPNTPGAVTSWPTPVREYLYQQLNNLNSYGSTDLADFSLSRALDARDSGPN